MSQTTDTSSPGTQPLQALCACIEREAPWLQIIRCVEHPYPFLIVQDTSNYGIHVTFSTEGDYVAYVHIIGRGRTNA